MVGWIGKGLGIDDPAGARSVADLLSGFEPASIPTDAATVLDPDGADPDGADRGPGRLDQAGAPSSAYGRRP